MKLSSIDPTTQKWAYPQIKCFHEEEHRDSWKIFPVWNRTAAFGVVFVFLYFHHFNSAWTPQPCTFPLNVTPTVSHDKAELPHHHLTPQIRRRRDWVPGLNPVAAWFGSFVAARRSPEATETKLVTVSLYKSEKSREQNTSLAENNRRVWNVRGKKRQRWIHCNRIIAEMHVFF